MGRPSDYTPEIEVKILEWISDGHTLRDFCRQDSHPAFRTVYYWLDANAEFFARFTRARQIGAHAIAEEALEIANTPCEGVTTTISLDGTREVREDMLGHRRLQVETRLKLLAKWFPQVYGDRTELTGPGGGPIIVKAAPLDDAL